MIWCGLTLARRHEFRLAAESRLPDEVIAGTPQACCQSNLLSAFV
jgi:hypothetical protein